MQIAHRSELGYVRTRNEDRVLVQLLDSQSALVGVADGMGGHPAGDVASRVATDAIVAAVEAGMAGDPEHWLEQTLRAAHGAVLSAADREPAYAGMGTTAVLGHVTPDRIRIAHVGDSRAYLVRANVATQLTHDHHRHGYLTQALGIPGDITPETVVAGVTPGDRVLLCTDGLSGLVSSEAIGVLAGTAPPPDACDLLVDAALTAGGYDNVSVVLVAV